MEKSYFQIKDELESIENPSKGIYGGDPIWMIVNKRGRYYNKKSWLNKEWVLREKVAKEFGFEYVAWYEAKVGEWGISDDGFVMPCYRIYELKNHAEGPRVERKQFCYPVGNRWCRWKDGKRTGKPFLVKEFLDSGHLGYHSGISRDQRWIKSTYVQKGLYLWAKLYYLRNGRITHADAELVLSKVRPHKWKEIVNPKGYLNWFIGKHVHIRNFAGIMLKKVFEENGLDAIKVSSMMNETFEMAKDNKDAKEMHAIVKTLLEIHENGEKPVEENHAMLAEANFKAVLEKTETLALGVGEEDYKQALGNMDKGVEMAILANENVPNVPREAI